MKKTVDSETMSRITKKPVDASEVVSRILTENILTLTQARAELGKITGVRPDKGTMARWIHRGVGGVKLEAIRLGSRSIFTSLEALNRFIVARTKTLGS